jgi:excisionase family DNA binding protein
MYVTLGTASRQCRVSKGTLSRAISRGKLSATRNEDGSWKIDHAELARYLEANQHRFRSEPVATTRLKPVTTPILQPMPWWPSCAGRSKTCAPNATGS